MGAIKTLTESWEDDPCKDDEIAYGPKPLSIYDQYSKDEDNPRLLFHILPNLQGDFLQSAKTQAEAAIFAKSIGGRLPTLGELMELSDARGKDFKDIQKKSLWYDEVLPPIRRGKNRKGRKFAEYKTFKPEDGTSKVRNRKDEQFFIVVCTP